MVGFRSFKGWAAPSQFVELELVYHFFDLMCCEINARFWETVFAGLACVWLLRKWIRKKKELVLGFLVFQTRLALVSLFLATPLCTSNLSLSVCLNFYFISQVLDKKMIRIQITILAHGIHFVVTSFWKSKYIRFVPVVR